MGSDDLYRRYGSLSPYLSNRLQWGVRSSPDPPSRVGASTDEYPGSPVGTQRLPWSCGPEEPPKYVEGPGCSSHTRLRVRGRTVSLFDDEGLLPRGRRVLVTQGWGQESPKDTPLQ